MNLHEVLVGLYFGHLRSFSECSSLVVDWRVTECGSSATCLGRSLPLVGVLAFDCRASEGLAKSETEEL